MTEKRQDYCANTLRPQLHQLNKYMAESEYVAGSTLTFVDFILWELLDHFNLFDENILMNFENLNSFKSRFASLPRIKEYLNSDRFMKSPCYGKTAK